MARAEKGTSRGHVVLASCKVVRHTHTSTLPPLVLTGDGRWGKCQEGWRSLPSKGINTHSTWLPAALSFTALSDTFCRLGMYLYL